MKMFFLFLATVCLILAVIAQVQGDTEDAILMAVIGVFNRVAANDPDHN